MAHACLPSRRAILAAAGGLAIASGVPAVAAEAELEEQPALAQLFADAGAVGTVVVFDQTRNRLVASDRKRAETGLRPHSTFKIANSLIALETGIVEDADHPVFKWDGKVRDIAAWNQDHTMRTAFRGSVVPVYQVIARKVGPERMARYVAALDYGNHDIGGAAIDFFWLGGDLRISAVEQIGFLRRLEAGQLPVSERAQSIVRDIMLFEQYDGVTLRAKTGLSLPGEPDSIGWFVGWAERGEQRTFFALNLDLTSADVAAKRISIAKAALASIMRP